MIAEGSPTGLAAAQERLRGCAALNDTHHNPGQLIGVLALQALASQQEGKVEDALAALERALTLAQPGGWVWPFDEFGPAMATLLQRLGKDRKNRSHIDRLLAAFPEQVLPVKASRLSDGVMPAVDADGVVLPEHLTNREEQILERLAERLCDKEIAARLSISSQTVNFHLKNLYCKLGIGSRREAAAKVAALGR